MSESEQHIELGRLVAGHKERREQYALLTAKLKRIGGGLQNAGATLVSLAPDAYGKQPEAAAAALATVSTEMQFSHLEAALREYIDLRERLEADLSLLRSYGIEK